MAAGLGFKDFTTGEVLTAADVDGYLMQGIWVFASAAARDAAVTSPQEGNACYLKDTNQVLTYSGSAWVAVLSISFNAQTAAYTLVAGDAFKLVTVSDTVSRTVTIPPSVFTAGQIINVQRIGTGAVPFAAGAGVTITSTGATASAPTLRAQYSAASIICTASNTFTVLGDIA